MCVQKYGHWELGGTHNEEPVTTSIEHPPQLILNEKVNNICTLFPVAKNPTSGATQGIASFLKYGKHSFWWFSTVYSSNMYISKKYLHSVCSQLDCLQCHVARFSKDGVILFLWVVWECFFLVFVTTFWTSFCCLLEFMHILLGSTSYQTSVC